jgi:GntR family transcriptional regulator
MPKKSVASDRAADFSRSPVARYIQLATLFRNRIASGEWPVGSRIPNVDELADAFSVARGTMREALGLLEQEGLLERLRAKGTFVRKSPVPPRSHNLALDWASLQGAHEGTTIEVIDHAITKVLPDIDHSKGTLAPKYRMIRRLFVRDARPYLVARFYVDDALFRQHATQFRKLPALPVLRRVAGRQLHRAWQTLTIGVADVELAAVLKMPLNAPVARVDRIAIDGNGVIIYAGQGIYRGDTICMEMELQ